jgi:hypothetical protein
VALLLLAGGCGVDRGSGKTSAAATTTGVEEPSPETFALGTMVNADGAVPQQATGETFVRGGEVFLSVNVQSASTDQTIAVNWIDPQGRVLRHDERHVPKAAHYVPFSSGATTRWPTGTHRAVVLIDGRTVSEKPFSVMDVTTARSAAPARSRPS